MPKADWITGKQIVEILKIKDFELLDLITKGLQPYNYNGLKIDAPDIKVMRKTMNAAGEEWSKLNDNKWPLKAELMKLKNNIFDQLNKRKQYSWTDFDLSSEFAKNEASETIDLIMPPQQNLWVNSGSGRFPKA